MTGEILRPGFCERFSERGDGDLPAGGVLLRKAGRRVGVPAVRAAEVTGHPRGTRWNSFRKLVFATYGDTCWLCLHGGARQVDHLESVTEHPELAWVLANCRPAHGIARGITGKNPCPVCSEKAGKPVYCNQLRGGYGAGRAKRIIAEMSREKTQKKPAVSDETDSGRDW